MLKIHKIVKFKIVYSSTDLTGAPCCSTWDEKCYTTNTANNFGHSCNKCDPPLCADDCKDPESVDCISCCRTVTHERPWNCSQGISGEQLKFCVMYCFKISINYLSIAAVLNYFYRKESIK